MRKSDVLRFLTSRELADIIGKHPSQVTRMPDVIPKQYHGVLRAAIRPRKQMLDRSYYHLMKS